ncbi:hypothetical protein [Bacillus sp. FJAT-45350]|uniref:hypothetical protein n=1 Tax=Bacillus sp. FJAT-45350 TaxID=2011014 RepID=UPI0015C950E3|nr:hypothetical protein [Bacillus sp. FJAT-45350]
MKQNRPIMSSTYSQKPKKAQAVVNQNNKQVLYGSVSTSKKTGGCGCGKKYKTK